MRIMMGLLLLVAACNTDGRSNVNGKDGGTNNNNKHDLATGNNNNPDMVIGKLDIDDPFPMYCGPGSMDPPPTPGGTVECPDDKNLQGCPCDEVGKTASCWPGMRVNRNLGQCKDGTTTCVQVDELNAVWSPCDGAVLPDPDATEGAAACKCFSSGYWDVANLTVCGQQSGSGGSTMYVAFGGMPPASGNTIDCSTIPALSTTWSTDTLKVDCAGHFKLCFTVKAGDAMNPQATDCVVGTSCAESDYTTANMTQAWAPLLEWKSSSSACVEKFFTSGGYGQMSVKGTSITCDDIKEHVFQTSRYCGQDEPGCTSGGGGPFGN